MKCPRWQKAELELIREHAPDYDRLTALLPTRSRRRIQDKAVEIGCGGHKDKFTAEEKRIIVANWPDLERLSRLLPARRSGHIRRHATRVLKLPDADRTKRAFSAAEIERLKEGVRDLAGRSEYAVASKRSRLGLVIRPNWTSAEKAALRAAPYSSIPGRSASAVKTARAFYGLCQRRGVRSSATGGATILEAVQRAIPRTLPRQIQQEVLSDLALAVLEGEIELAHVATAVRNTIKGVYKRYPVLGAPVSLDMRLFDDGGTTLGDRITSDAFHF